MNTQPILHIRNNFESELENNIDKAEIFFKKKGAAYLNSQKSHDAPQEFKDAVREYLRTIFDTSKCEEIIKKIPRVIMKYDAFFEEGKTKYKIS